MLTARHLLCCSGCGSNLRLPHPTRGHLCKRCFDAQNKRDSSKKALQAIQSLLQRDDVLILDTETNSMGKEAEIIELSVINTKGEILLDTLVKPKIANMNPFAQRVHGISLEMLGGAPQWPQIMPQLADLADRRTLLAWNASFDATMLEQTSLIWDMPQPRWLFVCAMRMYAKKRGIQNRGLHKCVADENLVHLFDLYPSHRALGDVMFVLEVLRATTQEPVMATLLNTVA